MVVAIIQARINSTRLPNKVFLNISDRPLIWHVVNRLTYSKKIEKIIIATTDNKKDDLLERWAMENNIFCFRGSEEDVLERYYQAAIEFDVDTILRITADDPFKDPHIIDQVIGLYQDNNLDFACNNNPPTFPEGLDVEVFSFDALKLAHINARDAFEREHVTQYFYRNPAMFYQKCLMNNIDISYLRWTIDTRLDYDMVQKVYAKLFHIDSCFVMKDILNLIQEKPEIAKINSGVYRSAMYSHK